MDQELVNDLFLLFTKVPILYNSEKKPLENPAGKGEIAVFRQHTSKTKLHIFYSLIFTTFCIGKL